MPQETPFCSQNSVFPCPPKGRQDMQGMSYQIVTKDQGRNSKDFFDPLMTTMTMCCCLLHWQHFYWWNVWYCSWSFSTHRRRYVVACCIGGMFIDGARQRWWRIVWYRMMLCVRDDITMDWVSKLCYYDGNLFNNYRSYWQLSLSHINKFNYHHYQVKLLSIITPWFEFLFVWRDLINNYHHHHYHRALSFCSPSSQHSNHQSPLWLHKSGMQYHCPRYWTNLYLLLPGLCSLGERRTWCTGVSPLLSKIGGCGGSSGGDCIGGCCIWSRGRPDDGMAMWQRW